MSLEQEISVKHNGKLFVISKLTSSNTISDLKEVIYELTNVRPEKQKIMGLKAQPGNSISDSLQLSELVFRPSTKLMMVGSTDETINEVNTVPENIPEVVDDLDCAEVEVAIANRAEYIAKVERRAKQYEITVINEPRPEKKLLVLDIDYTIFDHMSPAESARDLMRPYLHEFLAKAYRHFDLAIWSATDMTWIRAKLEEMALLPKSRGSSQSTMDLLSSANRFRISLLLDSRAMISVDIPEQGVKQVKPLGVIWAKYPQWGPQNTIMFDDVRRNFIMNPQSGLKIRAYRHAHRNRETDRELLKLGDYIELLSDVEDFRTLDHRRWESFVVTKGNRKRKEHPV